MLSLSMNNKLFTTVLFLFLVIPYCLGDDIKFNAVTSKTHVAVGENFVVTYSLNVSDANFQSPSFKGFTVLSGPSQSSSYSTQIYNGRVVKNVNIEVSYILMANNEGSFTIPPASIYVKGKSYQSNSLTIQVSKSNNNKSTQNQYSTNQKQGNQTNKENVNTGDVEFKDLFLKASIDKKNALLGEQLILTYKIYTRVQISQFYINKLSSFTGFWSQDITGKNTKMKKYEEVINGNSYVVAEIRKVALLPQKTGLLTIDPLEVECLVQIVTKTKDPFAGIFNDPFFSNFGGNLFESYQNVKKTLTSNSVSVNITPLPETNKPNDFSGAVGNYTISSSIDNTTAKAGDAITMKITLNGNGNLKLIDKLSVNFPSDFEVYDPKITDNISLAAEGMKGSRTFEYLIIPRNPGQFTIQAVNFSFFDINKKQYVTLSTEPYQLNIDKGSGNQSNVTVNTINKEDIKYVGSDIRYIKKSNLLLLKNNAVFFGTYLYLGLLLLPVLIFILFVIIWRKKIRDNSNLALMRQKKATKAAQKRLKKARLYLNENNTAIFYEEIFKVLWGYLSDKLNIPLSELSKETASDAMLKKGVSDTTASRFIEIINNCEFSRFAPGVANSEQMDTVFSDAASIITIIEKEIIK